VIRDEADKDYQLAAGIPDVEADDSILELTKARCLGLFCTFRWFYHRESAICLKERCLSTEFILFTPLIAAMAGNVGSAIISRLLYKV
jgi:Mg/Co/Ni transporter MgtE